MACRQDPGLTKHRKINFCATEVDFSWILFFPFVYWFFNFCIVRKHSVIFVAVTIGLFASGQSNFIRSVIINNNGDSIYGSIDYRNWKNNPTTVDFLNAANEKQTYSANTIRSFYIPSTHEVYTSFTVDMDPLPDDQDEALNNRFVDSSGGRKRVFLFQLVKHQALSLYLFATQTRDHFYYVRGNEQPVELIHHYVYDEASRQLVESATYKEQLAAIVASCPQLVSRAKATRFRQNEIQDITIKYLQCSAPGTVADVTKNDPVSFDFGIVGGVMLNQFNFTGTEPTLVDENYSSTLSPIVGLSLDIGLSRNRTKWHVVNELIYKNYNTDNSFTRPYGAGYTVTYDIDLSFSYLQLNSLVRYIFLSNGSLKPNINFGMANGLMIAENKNSSHRSYSFGDQEDVKAIDGPRKYEFSLLGGLGLGVRNNLQLELRYAGSLKSFSPYHNLDVNIGSLQFLATYHF